jgi:hypothetical protein
MLLLTVKQTIKRNTMASRLDKEKVMNNMAVILEKMESDADLGLLDEYRKLYKKEFPFFKRSWAAAWLLMYYDQREIPRSKGKLGKPVKPNKPDKRTVRKEAAVGPKEEKEGAAEYALPEKESKLLFISVGRKRRLYPKGLLSFILSKTPASREDLGFIRILDNYSFVQVRSARAQEIIEKLNGIKYRGRTLSVNYAKPKNGNETS